MNVTPLPARTVLCVQISWTVSSVPANHHTVEHCAKRVSACTHLGSRHCLSELSELFHQLQSRFGAAKLNNFVLQTAVSTMALGFSELSSSYELSFSESGSWDYTTLTGLHRNITEITVSFWMQSSDNENQGTPLSYATDENFNAFTLTDYSG